eukprot:snap_masked-scaffold_18-processed-gene-3.41-mRNA-1 protein AED:1.00 eAED:1.00 QI:0/0/0/0/1/1/2/0/71
MNKIFRTNNSLDKDIDFYCIIASIFSKIFNKEVYYQSNEIVFTHVKLYPLDYNGLPSRGNYIYPLEKKIIA